MGAVFYIFPPVPSYSFLLLSVVTEALVLLSNGVSAYDGDVVHEVGGH